MRQLSGIAAAVLSCGIVLGAGAAGAADQGNCIQLAQQVKTALASNAQSASYQDAQKEQGYGREFCNNGLSDRGVAHYQHALDLLGAGKS